MAVNSIETHESYRNGQVQMPGDDKRDMSNAITSKHVGVRNIVPLIGIMALRHEMAGNLSDQKLWKHEGLEEKQYEELYDNWIHEAEKLADEIYLFKSSKESGNAKASKLDGLLQALSGGGGGVGGNTPDTLETRTKAWFKAYSDWLNFTHEDDTSARSDDASLFEAGG